jgi:DNA-binding response OmpR family regulator
MENTTMAVSAKSAESEKQLHIHVINDTPEILDVFRMVLEDEGYAVTTDRFTTELGPKVVHVRELAPDLLVLDLIVNGEAAGWQLLQLLKMDRDARKIPIIICTAAVRTVDELHSHLDAMGIKVILKPFDIDHLLSVIKSVIDDGELPLRLTRDT